MNIRKKQSRPLLCFALAIVLAVSGVIILNKEARANHPDNYIETTITTTLGYDTNSNRPRTDLFTLRIKATPDSFVIYPTSIQFLPDYYRNTGVDFRTFRSQTASVSVTPSERFFPVIAYGGVDIPEMRGYVSSPMSNVWVYMYADGPSNAPGFGSFDFNMPPANPVISLRDIGQSYIEFSINNKGNSRGELQKYSNVNKRWENIRTDVTGGNYIYREEGLSPNTVYRYRTVHTFAGVTSYNWQGEDQFYVEFTTASDPAVVAAQKAENAAQLARIAAENSVQYSSDAKKAAESVGAKVDHPEYGLEALNDKIYNSVLSIQRIYNPEKSTFTFGQTFDIKINAAGVQKNLVYRVICDGFDSGWTSNNLITITGLTKDGTMKATVIVSNNPADPENGATVQDEFTFFKAIF